MPGQSWTPAEEAYLQALVEKGLDSAQIVAEFQKRGIARTQKAIRRLIERKGWTRKAQVPTATTPRFNQPLEVIGDPLILADIHAPFHDARWINEVADLAIGRGIKQLVIGGDLADFNAFSKWGADIGIDADFELDQLSKVMDELCAAFPDVYYFAGNHDVRPVRMLQNRVSVSWLMRMFTPTAHCQISDYHWCNLTSGDTEYMLTHPRNTSIHATLIPKKLCAKYNKSVIAHHGHTWGMTRDDSNRHWAIDSGICADPERLAYAQLVQNTRPKMMRGAVIVEGGIPLLLSPQNVAMFANMK